METRSMRKRIGPLPGGRQGASGADAGCHSMRTIGSERLSRRTATESYVTAEKHQQSSPSSSSSKTRHSPQPEKPFTPLSSPLSSLFASPSSSPLRYSSSSTSPSSLSSISSHQSRSSKDVVQRATADYSAPTLDAKHSRKKWSDEENMFIWRTYLTITKLETDTKSYLDSLHHQFHQKYPNLNIPKQRLGGQRRAICQNKLLSTDILNLIRTEVAETLKGKLQSTEDLCIKTEGGRMKWSNELNESIMRFYYTITEIETNKTAFRKTLHEMFITKYPQLSNLSEQRIADQRRAIIHNKYIRKETLDKIKGEVAEQLKISERINVQTELNLEPHLETTDDRKKEDNTTDTNYPTTEPNPSPMQRSQLQNDRDEQIDSTFMMALEYFSTTEPTNRPYVPKQKCSKNLARIVAYLNKTTLPETANIETNFDTLQTLVYCAAWTAAKLNGSKLTIPPAEIIVEPRQVFKPKWQNRLERKIANLRTKIAHVTLYKQGNRTHKIVRSFLEVQQHYKQHTLHETQNTEIDHFLDTLKQKLTVAATRLKRYNTCTDRKVQNKKFKHNERQFYRDLKSPANKQTFASNPISKESLHQFWSNIWEHDTKHNSNAEWIEAETLRQNTVKPMEFRHVTIDTFLNVLKNLHNWKAPGSDKIHSYWYKKLSYIHPFLHNHMNQFIQQPDTMPKYLSLGTTYMLPKDLEDLQNPSKYRPITCLQTFYKIITACISEVMYSHLEDNNVLAEQQKGCRKRSRGCKEQLIIDSVVVQQSIKSKSDIFTMYIDYKKAYDSVPHSWLLQVLKIYNIHPTIASFLSYIIKSWQTHLQVESSLTDPIKILRGIFQGDALSPLWFCFALNPLSNTLQATKTGLKITYKTEIETNNVYHLNHLLYMDDIKLYAGTEQELNNLATLTETYSNDISMELGIDKCKINSIKSGNYYAHTYTLESGQQIEPLAEDDGYKYLGYVQSKGIHHKEIKAALTKEYRKRLIQILKSKLCARSITKAINTFAVPVLTYSFGVINWTKSELLNLQRLINTSMTKHRKHHPRACFQRQTLPRADGGRGLIDITNLHNSQITNLRTYFQEKAETSDLHKAIIETDKRLTPLNLSDRNQQKNEAITAKSQKISDWSQKPLHGRHQQDLCQPNVDKVASNAWLRHGALFPETEGFLVAIQDQVIETRNYQKHIMKVPNMSDDLCRKCRSASETIQHITSACKAISNTEYKHRHDQIANIIHQKLIHKYKLTTEPTQPYYKHQPKTVIDTANYKLYYDRAIITDRTVHHNRPDITFVDKITKTAFLIDIAVPNTHNLQTTLAEKISKYVDLKIEIMRMWHLQRVTIVLIVISSTGVIPKQLHQSLSTLDLNPSTYVIIQKAAILNTCRIVRKFFQSSYELNHPVTNQNLQQPTRAIQPFVPITPPNPSPQTNTHYNVIQNT